MSPFSKVVSFVGSHQEQFYSFSLWQGMISYYRLMKSKFDSVVYEGG